MCQCQSKMNTNDLNTQKSLLSCVCVSRISRVDKMPTVIGKVHPGDI